MRTRAHLSCIRVDSPTEARNPNTMDIDRVSSLEVLRLINDEDRLVPDAVAEVLPQLADAVDLAVQALRAGGRVHYVGAGTSGRLAVLDAAELIPTYNMPAGWFVAHQAGGASAFVHAVEGAEDDADAGATQIRGQVGENDFVLGLTASGRTPFVLGALSAARSLGAATGLVSANPANAAAVEIAADVVIAVNTGPEAIAGSTRMKAGTAQKLILTAFSTAVMVRLGRTYSNLMISMVASNAKLRGRTLTILQEATGADELTCETALMQAGGEVKTALVTLLTGADIEETRAALLRTDGHVREALTALAQPTN
ncbi:N-acetylmuramic acid 6-phosphate etherase [Actinoalloteichus hymeniacidonis]|uniref:N-acetylmuramic acid 6-phosphate etherase n=1 Tax=Actinoalloteichus hymeniacidonis TaxID=340345 RepID=A0AAC9HKX8_9PSEU|nr:N-acetylmuramic acid 6-phosphate etherase [Actinoalloteichus hymeniacidonis]AOS61120.1 N-acetylmuramic acid 6-phosphate etherase [Actinoalloteichus hymeniacidonis]MBB5910879.1 N-acetylmuramic acid 6-phosphate etherase [Actinoalloteichus hymeniacidonis]